MPYAPRVALASGLAAAAGAAFILLGRLDASAVTALILVTVARAAPVSATGEPGFASRSSSIHAALIPAWVGICAVAVVRAGSVQLADVRGANAVAGLALFHGQPIAVAAAWLAAAAGVLALVAPLGRAAFAVAVAVAPPPLRRLELIGVAAQVALLVSFFAGPQISGAGDVIPWLLAGASVVSLAAVARRIAWVERSVAIATVLATVAVVLIAVAGPV